MALEGKQTLLEFFQRREIVGREELSLNDGEIDFDLIEPTGVDELWMRIALGHLVRKRSTAFWPR